MSSDKKPSRFSRRSFLGGGLLLPFLSMAETSGVKKANKPEDHLEGEEYTTMLTSGGEAVRVRKDSLKKAKVVKKNMSNQSLLSWLKLKDKK